MANSNNSDFIDFGALLRQYIKKWYLFAISVGVCLALALLFIYVRKPVYAVRANLLVAQENSNPMEAKMGDIGALFGADGKVDDEIFIVSSHSLYRDVVRDLGLNIKHYYRRQFLKTTLEYPTWPIDVTPQAGVLDTLRRGILFKIDLNNNGKAAISAHIKRKTVAEVEDVNLPYVMDTPLGQFTIAKTQYCPANEDVYSKVTVSGYDGAAEELSLDVAAEIANKRSNVIQLSINTTNTDYGEAILDDVIRQYNLRGFREKNNQGEQTEKFIDERLVLISENLNKTEAEMQKYNEKKGIVNLGVETQYQTEKRAEIEAELLKTRTQREIMQMTVDFLNKPDNEYALIPITVENIGLQTAIQLYNDQIMSRNDLLRSAKENNTALVSANERIALSRANILSALYNALRQQQIALEDLMKEYSNTGGYLSQVPLSQREYTELRRQQEVQQGLYLYLLKSREENSMLMANTTPKGQIIDAAFTYGEPLGLGNKIIAILALLFGLMIPPVWLYVKKIFHNRFETRQDVEKVTEVPILGEMCIDRTGRQLVVASDDTTATAELFRLMRSNLLFVLNDANDKVVLMTSSSSGEGKSFISINLAASLALLDKRVLLVGMDIRNPRLAEYLDIAPRFGLTQYLSSDNVTLDSMITPIGDVPGLDVIVAGPVPPNPAELLMSRKVDQLFKTLRGMYDYIIVDTAPIGLVSDTFTLDRIADAAIYVCRANYTSLSDLAGVNDIYEHHRLKKLSLVINGSAANKTYGYGRKKSHR